MVLTVDQVAVDHLKMPAQVDQVAVAVAEHLHQEVGVMEQQEIHLQQLLHKETMVDLIK